MSTDALRLSLGPRKTHRKSKSGCRTCKQRKIKCDETRPICNNCTRRYGKDDAALCNYGHGRRHQSSSVVLTVSSRPSRSSRSSRPKHSRSGSDEESSELLEGLSNDVLGIAMLDEHLLSSIAPDSASSADLVAPDDMPWSGLSSGTTNLNITDFRTPTRLRSLIACESPSQSQPQSELELFQHFMSSTCNTMPLIEDPEIRHLWTVKVPQMALRCPFLLESVAMIAAFYLRSPTPSDERLVVQSHHFYGLALRSTREELSRVSQFTAEQLVISSFLLSIASWRFRTGSTESYAVPNEAFQTSIAAVQVYLSTWSWLESVQSTVHKFFSSLDLTRKWSEVHNKKRYSDAVAMLDGLDDMNSKDTNEQELIRHLMAVHSCLYQTGSKDAIRHRLVQTALNPPQCLTQGLQDKNPLALAVWARIMSLWTEVEGTWWTSDIAKYEMSGIQHVFEDCGYDDELLNWPLARFAREGE
ncbi:hypothetical protein G647_01556 [Cladophialophora carrionii CBS 160.54]|uniref:Zn(2)-C6 fungal-type domain-containing protein n=1 Tax=Cladophialophora carrionii CBS 160.54 TaxID=1279043 RepID=V9DS12_9EURO|nr:uncharacterized protein G647_01556 [Cladophialophora carrionii CBS 160.54]ETI29103.1 hypothetical protein G647_01556 [Cladophialophora carrionii CBS 160.54]